MTQVTASGPPKFSSTMVTSFVDTHAEGEQTDAYVFDFTVKDARAPRLELRDQAMILSLSCWIAKLIAVIASRGVLQPEATGSAFWAARH